ncbi:hypothetical protein HY251_01505 [bacterium]|nr:hypothetical protein [bacterium]
MAMLALGALISLSPVRAEDAGKAASRREEAALAAVADELHRLARFCESYRAYPEARAELELGLEVDPGSQKLKDELAKLEKTPAKDAKPPASFSQKYEDERKKTHEKCGDLLADWAVLCDKDALSEPYERALGLVQRHFPGEKALARIGGAWFDPYQKLVRKDDVAALDSGSELVSGKWLDKAAVAALDREHATWANPWVISDEAHELKTTLPLRTARRLLAHIGSFRAFFLGKFAGSWDLRRPRGKLPVIVTETQADMKARMDAEAPGARQGTVHGAAHYLFQPHRALSPCFVTFEPAFTNAPPARVSFEQVLIFVRHEVTHQIAIEYSKHDAAQKRDIAHQYWCVEGIANYMQAHAVEKGKWRLTHPREIAMGPGTTPGDFVWCAENASTLPSLEDLFALPRERFASVRDYHMAATVAHFLLDGEDGRYRSAFTRLLETVHKVRDDAKTLDACFAGIDRKKMQEEWRRFLSKIKVD